MNPSAILIGASAIAASVVGLVLLFFFFPPATTAVMGRLWPCSTSGELQAHQACWAARRRMEQVKLGNISCGVGASQIEWGTFTKSQQEFKVSMCVSNYLKKVWARNDEKRQGPSCLIGFHFHCVFSFGVFSWDIWRALVHHLRICFRRLLRTANWCLTSFAMRSLKYR